MFTRILVPIDLAHLEALSKATHAASVLANAAGARLVFLGVTPSVPTAIAASPQEFEAKLQAFAREQSTAHGVPAQAKVIVTGDPTTDVDRRIITAAEEVGADLVVMQTHMPAAADFLWQSRGEYVATHAPFSVMLVR
ncbi:MAG: universal stress protein [Pseudomonadota bacterium]